MFRIVVQIIQHLLFARINRRAVFVIEIAKARHHPTGVGRHPGSHAGVQRGPVPLLADFVALPEDREVLTLEMTRGDQTAKGTANDGHFALQIAVRFHG